MWVPAAALAKERGGWDVVKEAHKRASAHNDI
jgi:hypothetical protein